MAVLLGRLLAGQAAALEDVGAAEARTVVAGAEDGQPTARACQCNKPGVDSKDKMCTCYLAKGGTVGCPCDTAPSEGGRDRCAKRWRRLTYTCQPGSWNGLFCIVNADGTCTQHHFDRVCEERHYNRKNGETCGDWELAKDADGRVTDKYVYVKNFKCYGGYTAGPEVTESASRLSCGTDYIE